MCYAQGTARGPSVLSCERRSPSRTPKRPIRRASVAFDQKCRPLCFPFSAVGATPTNKTSTVSGGSGISPTASGFATRPLFPVMQSRHAAMHACVVLHDIHAHVELRNSRGVMIRVLRKLRSFRRCWSSVTIVSVPAAIAHSMIRLSGSSPCTRFTDSMGLTSTAQSRIARAASRTRGAVHLNFLIKTRSTSSTIGCEMKTAMAPARPRASRLRKNPTLDAGADEKFDYDARKTP